MPALGEPSSYIPKAASAENSRKSEPGSSRRSIALAGGELISPAMLFERFGAAAGSHRDETLAQLGD